MTTVGKTGGSGGDTARSEAWWRDFAWEDYATNTVLYPTVSRRIVEVTPSTPLVPLKCVSCGAPMKSAYKCEYCGTRYGVFPR
jgi:hypothetical protein